MKRLSELQKTFKEEEKKIKRAKKEFEMNKMKNQGSVLKKKKKQHLNQCDNLSVHESVQKNLIETKQDEDDTKSLKSLQLRHNKSIKGKNNYSISPKSSKTNRSNLNVYYEDMEEIIEE